MRRVRYVLSINDAGEIDTAVYFADEDVGEGNRRHTVPAS